MAAPAAQEVRAQEVQGVRVEVALDVVRKERVLLEKDRVQVDPAVVGHRVVGEWAAVCGAAPRIYPR